MDCLKLFSKRLMIIIKEACDQDLTHCLDTLTSFPVKSVPEVVIRDVCDT